MIGLIIALAVTAALGGAGWAVALRPSNTDEVVEAVALNTSAALAPVLEEQATLRATLEDGRLDRHCSAKVGQTVNARAIGCMWVECTQVTAAAGRTGSKECADVYDLYAGMAVCEAQTEEQVKSACLKKLAGIEE